MSIRIIDNAVYSGTITVGGNGTFDGNVGIGTTSPSRRLDVRGDAQILSTGSTGLRIVGGTTSEVYMIFGDADDNSMGGFGYNNNTNELSIDVNNSEAIRIDSSGNVGIGTTNPGYKLHVAGSIMTEGINVFKNTTSGIINTFENYTGYVLNRIYADYNNDATIVEYQERIGVDGNNSRIGNYSNHPLYLMANNVDVVTITGSGNVGIGTTSPSYKLHVEGGDIGVGPQYAIKARYNASEDYHSSLRWAGLQLGNNGANRIIAGRTGAGGYLEFWVNNTNDASVYSTTPDGNFAMKIASDGNVGIGTTSPGAKLDVISEARISYSPSNQYRVRITNSDGNGRILVDGDTSSLIFGTSGTGTNATATERMRITSTGNVGIGTTTTDGRLKISAPGGHNAVSGISLYGNNGGLYGGSNVVRSKIESSSDGTAFGANMLFSTNDTSNVYQERMRITSAGNVGIGIASPGVKLDVTDVIRGRNSIRVDGAETGSPYFGLYQNGSEKAYIQYVDSGDNLTIQSDGIVTLRTGSTERMRITSGGNVGIGTTNIGTQSNLYLGAINSTEGGQITLQKATSGTLAAHIDAYTTGGNDYMRILSGGDTSTTAAPFVFDLTNVRVGIGTTSPSQKLHVSGNTYITDTLTVDGGGNTLLLRKGTGNAALTFAGTSDQASGLIEGVSGGGLNIYTSNGGTVGTPGWSSRIYITSTGNVGIGTTNPSSKLTVNGSTESISLNTDHFRARYNSTYYTDYSTNGVRFNGTNQTYSFIQNGTNRMSINASGNVGIGTTSPTQKLQVDGSTQLGRNGNNTAGDPHKTIISGQGIEDAGTGDFYGSYGFLELNANNNYTGSARRIAITNGLDANKFAIIRSDTNMGPMQLGVAGAVPTGAVADFVIDTSGNVGIGTTGPGAKLVVSNGTQALSVNPYSTGIDLHSTGDLSPHYQTNFTLYTGAIGSGSARVTVNSAGNVGIGTTSPTNKLHIDSAIDNAYALRVQGNTNNVSGVWTGIGIAGEGANTKSAILFEDIGISYSRGKLHFALNNDASQANATPSDAVMTLIPDGNVGIGTTNPTWRLQTESSLSTVAMFRSSDSNTIVGIDNSAADGDPQLKFYINDIGKFTLGVDDSDGDKFKIGTSDLTTNTRLTILPTGNVGIGTTNPKQKLIVEGTLATKPNGVDGYYSYLRSNWAQDNAFELGISDNGETIFHKLITSSNYFYGSTLQFWTSDTEKMRIDSAGNVGIGTTSPDAKLDVNGNIRGGRLTSNDIVLINKGASDSIEQGSSVYLDGGSGSSYTQLQQGVGRFTIWGFYGGWAEKMTIRHSDGNVGIGTTSPNKKLSVEGGDIKLNNNNANADYYLWLNKKEGRDGGILLQRDNSLDWQITNLNTSGDLNFYSYGVSSAVMRIQRSTGNVGIGTTNPGSRRLSVVKDSGITAGFNDITEFLDTTLGGGGSVSLNIGRANSTKNLGKMAFKYASSGSNNNALNFGFYDADNLMTLQAGGNVGIGTTNPTRQLEVSNTGNAIIRIAGDSDNDVGETGDAVLEMTTDAGGHGWSIRSANISGGTGDFKVNTFINSVESTKLLIDRDGNVGIGTTNPGAKLQVDGTVRFVDSGFAGFEAHNTNGTWESFIGTETGGGGNRYNSASSQHTFYNNSSAVVRINSSGNVGIGTTAPSSKLTVKSPGEVGSYGDGFVLERNGTSAKLIRMYESSADGFLEVRTGADSIISKISGYSGTPSYFLSNVGIRTTSPDSSLTVSSGTANNVANFKSTDAAAYIAIADNSSSGALVNQIGVTGNDMWFATNSTEKMRITSSGNVGIGVTNPGAKLDVVGTMSVDGDSTFQQFIKAPQMQNYANNNDAIINGLTPGTLYHTNGTVKIVI